MAGRSTQLLNIRFYKIFENRLVRFRLISYINICEFLS